MQICMLLEQAMYPYPESLNVLQNYGEEHLVDDSGKTLATGRVIFAECTEDVLVSWLRKFDCVWQCSSPMIGDWQATHINQPQVDNELTLYIPRSAWLKFKHSYKTMDRSLRMGQAFHQWFGLEKITSEPNRAWCDKLYLASAPTVTAMVESRLDHQN